MPIPKTNKDNLWAFHKDYLNINLNGDDIATLTPSIDLKSKEYPLNNFNKPDHTGRINWFTQKTLNANFCKDYKKSKILTEALIENVNRTKKHEDARYESKALEPLIPDLQKRMQYMMVANKNYAAKIKPTRNCQNQFVYRLDIDTHDTDYFTENNIKSIDVQKDLIHRIDKKCTILFSEISKTGSGAHVYIGFNVKNNYNFHLDNLRKYFNNLLTSYTHDVKIKSFLEYDLAGKVKIDVLGAKSLLALPMNTNYEYYDIKTRQKVDKFKFYSNFIEPSFSNPEKTSVYLNSSYERNFYPNLNKQKKKFLTLRNLAHVVERQERFKSIEGVSTENIPVLKYEGTGWEKQKGKVSSDYKFKDTNLLITPGTRVENTKRIIFKMLSINHFYTFEQFMGLIQDHLIGSKDITSWSVERFHKNYQAFYDYYVKMYEQNSINSIKPQEFYSNIHLIPNPLIRKINRIASNTIKRQGYSNKQKIESDIHVAQLIMQEMIGYQIYISQGNKSRIKDTVRLTKINKNKAFNNFQLGRKWLAELKNFYGIVNVDVERLHRLVLDHSGMFERVRYNRGRSYINLNGIKIATTFNCRIKVILNQSLDSVIDCLVENLNLLLRVWSGHTCKYYTMCKAIDTDMIDSRYFHPINLESNSS